MRTCGKDAWMKEKWHNTRLESATCWGGFISLYCPINILTVIKLRIILCVGHVARVEKKAEFVFIFVYGLPEERNLFCCYGHGFESMCGLQFFGKVFY
jgi:hypothetical protein